MSKAKVLYNYESRSPKEISLTKDQFIVIIKQDDTGWSEGLNERGEQGWFPTSFVEPIEVKSFSTARKKRRPMSTRLFGKKGTAPGIPEESNVEEEDEDDSILSNKKKTTTYLAKWMPTRTKQLKDKGFVDDAYEAPGSMKGQETIFGLSLDEIISKYGSDIPPMVTQCTEFLRSSGALKETGIFRLSGVASSVNELGKQFFEVGSNPDLSDIDCNAITGAYKKLFRELPEPLFTFDAHDALLQATQSPNPVPVLKEVLKTIPQKNYVIIEYLIRFLSEVTEYSDVNKMAASNLGIVFGPTLMRNREESLSGMMNPMNNPAGTISALITHCDEIFGPKQESPSESVKSTPPPIKQRPSSLKISDDVKNQFVPDAGLLAKLAVGKVQEEDKRPLLKSRSKTEGIISLNQAAPVDSPPEKPSGMPEKPPKPSIIAPKPQISPKPARNEPTAAAPPPIPAKPVIPPKPTALVEAVTAKSNPSAPPKPAVAPKPTPPSPTPVQDVKPVAITLYDYTGDASLGQLSFKAGQHIEVVSKHPSGWWTGILAGTKGLFPINFVSVPQSDEF